MLGEVRFTLVIPAKIPVTKAKVPPPSRRTPAVIPANAWRHPGERRDPLPNEFSLFLALSPRKRDRLSFVWEASKEGRRIARKWIPAFAGMTAGFGAG